MRGRQLGLAGPAAIRRDKRRYWDKDIGEEIDPSDELALSFAQMQVLETLQGTMTTYFPQHGGMGARTVVVEAFEQADQVFGEGAAKEWASDFQLPEEIIENHKARFAQAGGSLVRMATEMREERRESRINVERVQAALSEDNPERERVMEFAEKGVELLLPPDFVASGVEGRPAIRNKQRETGKAVTKMMMEGYVQEGLAIVLPLDCVQGAQEEVGVLATSWARNHGKELGRTVVDANDGGMVQVSMATRCVKQRMPSGRGL